MRLIKDYDRLTQKKRKKDKLDDYYIIEEEGENIMPIADPFATPAAVAPAGGTEDLSWTELDVGSGWTAANPSDLGSPTHTMSGEFVNLTWDVADPVSDNAPLNGANFNGPRIYKKLVKPDGSDYRLDDDNQNIMLQVWFEEMVRPADSGGDNPLLYAILGITDDPTATSRASHFNVGLGFGYTGTTTNRAVTFYCGTTQNVITNTNTRRAQASYSIVGKRGQAVNGVVIKSDGVAQQTSSRNTNKLFSGTGPLYLCLDWGPSSLGNRSDGIISSKIRYKIINFNEV